MASKRKFVLYSVMLVVIAVVLVVFLNLNPASTGETVQEKHISEPQENHTGPKIVFSQTELHLGKVFSGDKATAEFVFKNLGSETLVIERVRAG